MDAEWLHSLLLQGYDVRQLLERIRQARGELDRGRVPELFPREIVKDHRELVGRKINPNGKVRITQDMAELTRRQAEHPLVPLLPELAHRLGALPGSDRMLALIDRDGFVLGRAGGSSMKQQAGAFCLVSGVNWAGEPPATNAVRMSVKLKKSVVMIGHQHFRRDQYGVACISTPVFGSNGRLTGFLDVVCPAAALTIDLPRLVNEVALNIRSSVDRVDHKRLNFLNQEAGMVLPRQYPKGLLVIDWHGWVAAAHEWDADQRVAAPEGGFTLGLNELPAFGQVMLEPVWGGWLVRRPEPGESTPEFELTLDVRHRNPSRDRAGWITINGPIVSWEPHELSLKQAEILLLIARSGRDGLTEDQLTKALYPVPPAPTTARSACHRVRDVLRSVLVSKPYRFAERVRVTVRYPSNMADLLPGSVAPGIVRLRQ